jgi:hypothetical protein
MGRRRRRDRKVAAADRLIIGLTAGTPAISLNT